VSGEAWKILIVDGSAAARAELRGLLAQGSARRYEIIEAETGSAGVALCAAGAAPDCLLLADELPDMDALGVLSGVRGERETLPFPVVVLGDGAGPARDTARALLRAGAMELGGKACMNALALTRAVENAVDRFALLSTTERAHRGRERERLVEAQFEAVIDAMADGVVVFDMAGNVVLLNEAEARINGFASAADMRRDIAYFATVYELSPEDGQPLPVEAWPVSRVLRGETVTDWQLRTRRLDTGQEWRINFSGAPVRDPNGDQVLGVVITRDITSQKRVEAALRESEARFRALADNMSQLAWIGDEKGWLFWYNQRWFDYTGTTLEEMQGWGWRQVHHPEHVDRVASKFERHIETGEAWEDTFPLRAKDGTYRWFLSRALPIRDDAGKIVRWFGTNTDITAQRNAEEALREADRRKDAFLAMLAHELRNPLAPARTAIHILRKVGSPEPMAVRARDIIDRQVTHMARLIDDLLDVSRISRGKLQLRKERCDLAQIVRQTLDDYRANLESEGLAWTVSEPREPLWVDGDPTRLVQMVGNLLNNAIRFTEPGGRVSVRVEEDRIHEAAVVTIEDTGIGMEPALLSRLFDPFSQAEQGIGRSKGGLGLGLALTKGLVELHGGAVAAQSEGLARGSTFTLKLPLAPGAARPAEPRVQSTSADGLRVLVIEDNEDAAETLAELLSLAGHEVKVAFEGRTGIDAARAARPDVVISDIGLPGGTDGYAVARALRGAPSLAPAFLIALSGYAQEEDQRRSLEAGFDAHLAKPPDLKKLEALLASVRRRD